MCVCYVLSTNTQKIPRKFVSPYLARGFDLRRHAWSPMNRFQTGQGPCRANLHKRGLAQSPSCDCGQRQTMNHIVDTCPLTEFEGGLNLYSAYGQQTSGFLAQSSKLEVGWNNTHTFNGPFSGTTRVSQYQKA